MPNRLAREQSPYLLQHANNPVDWYPWGDEAFNAARSSGKPIFLSIGYATCHWCHVMERESFESEGVARVLIGFNTGVYQTIDLSQWIAGNPTDVLATNFGKPASLFEKFPKSDVFIAAESGPGGAKAKSP